uniref:Uncharacterized protein n=1 Tax=Mucochytrium quahogii TaxID=96639 RepID=A0A7S2R9U4_9STRA|mmetsp:Transcript_29336/g.47081  ORF Transcript_29336/g.47081 Transcript_29336/m.47081 type:complete len:282 (+) Transcript_29336:86-931(+)
MVFHDASSKLTLFERETSKIAQMRCSEQQEFYQAFSQAVGVLFLTCESRGLMSKYYNISGFIMEKVGCKWSIPVAVTISNTNKKWVQKGKHGIFAIMDDAMIRSILAHRNVFLDEAGCAGFVREKKLLHSISFTGASVECCRVENPTLYKRKFEFLDSMEELIASSWDEMSGPEPSLCEKFHGYIIDKIHSDLAEISLRSFAYLNERDSKRQSQTPVIPTKRFSTSSDISVEYDFDVSEHPELDFCYEPPRQVRDNDDLIGYPANYLEEAQAQFVEFDYTI